MSNEDFEQAKYEEEIITPETDEPSFAEELENYLPTPENTDKIKKPYPAWLISAVTAFAVCVAVLTLYSLLIFPHIKPSAVISYSSNSSDNTKIEDLEGVALIAEKTMPCVVSVSSKANYQGFFGMSSQTLSGSGIVISENGYILTCYSLVGSNGEATVKIGKDTYTAKFVGGDASKDIAIIKIEAEGLKFATLDDSENIHTGDNVIAMANVLGGDIGISVTKGIICGVNKGVTLSNGNSINLLQTDAITGVSGGPLLNEKGNVIGMLTASISTESAKIGLAIPSADIMSVAESVINTGLAPSGLIIGIRGNDTEHGVTVETVNDGSPAKKAGIKVGDLILKVDGTTVKSVAEINKIRDTHKKGDTIIITVYRDGEVIDINVIL
ncbi:MAG: trypsin-like peptidase domain-containing protein [Clostridia bacterium]|nr:trypsin-like peptidase domain-containing protein [Clostridia bacterium]